MSNESQLRELLARSNKLEQESKIKEKLIPIVQQQEEVNLPTIFEPVQGLSLTGDETGLVTKDAIMRKYSFDAETYSNLNLNQEQLQRIKKSVGRMTHGASASVPITCKGVDCSYVSRCVHGDTEILVDGLTTKRIKDLTVGEYVYSINQESLLLEKKKILDVFVNPVKPIYKVKTLLEREVLVTDNHPFAVYENEQLKWVTIQDGLDETYKILSIDTLDTKSLTVDTVGDCLIDQIVEIEYVFDEVVYDIEVEDNHNFIGNGIVLHNCPFADAGTMPVGRPCAVETLLAEYWTSKYMDDLDINPDSISEMHALSNLVEISILENRVTMFMAINEQDLTMDYITSFDEDGNAITNKAISNAYEIRERLDKRKLKTLESLNSTREKRAKLQLQTIETTSQASTLISIKEQMQEAFRQLKNSGKVINAE